MEEGNKGVQANEKIKPHLLRNYNMPGNTLQNPIATKEVDRIILISMMKKLRLRLVKLHTQSYTADEWPA